MREKCCEEHEACNAIGAPLSSWSWYEKFHNILGGTQKMISVVGGIDQGFHLPHPQVVKLDDHPNSILETQPLESLERQTPVFVDSNDHVTANHTFNQAFDIVSPRTRACNLPSTIGKPNNKVTCKKRCLFGEFPSIAEAIKEYSQTAKELELLKKKMTKEIATQILESEQVGRKLLLKGQLQMAILFVEVLKA
jgi:hypothetical protein